MEYDKELLENMFKTSYKIKNPNKPFTEFFNNASKAIILDIFFDNPNTDIYTLDLLKHAGLSRKVIYTNMPILLKLGVISEKKMGLHKFFRLNDKHSDGVVKQISKFRDTLLYHHGSSTGRHINKGKLHEKKSNR
jgi:hypothetical protein